MLRNLLLSCFFLLFFQGKSPTALQEKEMKILYVGNSLTYVNNLPGLVAEIAMQKKVTIAYETFLFPDYSLQDHWKEGKVVEEIKKGKYDFVIAQQGPSALPESQELLLEYTTKFAKLCRDNNSKLALYMVWPSKARLVDLDNVIKSYATAAAKTGSLLCPAGDAWKNAWQMDPSIALYGPDNFHPGIDGSLLAALTVCGMILKDGDLNFVKIDRLSCKDFINSLQFGKLKLAAVEALKHSLQ
jgi:hypothetical protein